MKAKSIMVQGTASDSGKSTICTALCRYYANQKYRVFPFKSQNMALNSVITSDGNEISKAQTIQGEAAYQKPDIRMNPIFLKPSSDSNSEVILNGKPHSRMSAKDYQEFKIKLKPFLKETYEEIESENDLIILEGAGSPAEINLQENDIVNMGMADIADSPVILVADIDLGGVFASLYGTIKLQKPEHQKRIKGIIINKFRGDIKVLQDGLDMIEDLTGVPVIGVIPYLDINIEEEDSVALKKMPTQVDPSKDIDLAIIGLTKIANFSDFESLKMQDDLSVRFIREASQFGQPDILIIPDSNSPKKDLQWLKEKKLDQYIQSAVKQGTHVLGLGTGYYFLGNQIIWADGEFDDGLGLAEMDVAFLPEKSILTYKSDFLEAMLIQKAEVTAAKALPDFLPNEGLQSKDGLINGTELINLFDNVEWVRQLLNHWREKNGLEAISQDPESYQSFKNCQYDILAEEVTKHIDLKALNKIIFEGE